MKSGMVAMSRVDFNVIKISEGVSAGMSRSIYLSILKIKLRKEGIYHDTTIGCSLPISSVVNTGRGRMIVVSSPAAIQ